MPTMKDVAERAGTSTAVVSYVLNDGPRGVAPATRERVLRAADELGYQPNVVAQALRKGSTRSVGLVVPDICNPYFAELARAIEKYVAAAGSMLLIADSGLDPRAEEEHLRVLIERQVDSVILISTAQSPNLGGLAAAKIPTVALHPLSGASFASSLTIDYQAASTLATRHLLEHGYHDLRLLNGPVAPGASQHEAGFAAAIAAYPGEVRSGMWRSPISRHEAAALVSERLAAGDRPRAVYCSTDEQAFGVLFAAFEAGLRVPDDLAVVGFDGTANTEVCIPPLTTVQQPRDEFARRAVELLAEDRSGQPPTVEVLGYDFIRRRSCGC